MLPVPRAFGASNELVFGPVIVRIGTSGTFSLSTGGASLLPIAALHFSQCLFCKVGLFPLQKLSVISLFYTGWLEGLGHCSCKTSANLGWSGYGREEVINLSYLKELSPALLVGR